MRRGLRLVHVLGILAVAHPNCSRSCPEGFFSCTCEWDWQECPPPPSCGSSTGAITPLGDSGMLVVAFPDGAVRDAKPGGSLAFASTVQGTFLVAAIPEVDRVRVVRVDAPLRASLLGDVRFAPGAQPTRLVADDDQGTVHVLVTGSHTVVTLDPATLAVVGQEPVCDGARALAMDPGRGVAVACASGDVVTLDPMTGEEKRRVFVERDLQSLAVGRDVLVTTTRTCLFMLGADDTLVKDDRVAQAMVAFDPANVFLARGGGVDVTSLDAGVDRSLDAALTNVTDMAVDDDGQIAVAADGKVLVSPPGRGTALSPLAIPGYATAVTLSHGLLGAETTEATLVVVSVDDADAAVVVE